MFPSPSESSTIFINILWKSFKSLIKKQWVETYSSHRCDRSHRSWDVSLLNHLKNVFVREYDYQILGSALKFVSKCFLKNVLFSLLYGTCPGNLLFPYFLFYSNSWWYIFFYINFSLVMKIILHSNVTNLSDFTNGVYFLCQMEKNIFTQKISFLASRWSQLQLNVVYNIQRKRICGF